MEIAYVGPVPPLTGGIAQHGARLTEALAELGHKVHVYSWAAQYPQRLYAGPPADVDADPLPGASFELRWWDPVSWWRVGRRARGLDLLVFPWVTPLVAPAYRTMVAAAAPTPVVAVVHNLHPHEARPGDRQLTRWVLRRLHGALLHSSVDARTLEVWEPHLRVAVVAHPPNVAITQSPAPDAPPYRLLFFGHVRAYKGLDLAIEAVRILLEREARVELTIAGHFWEPVDVWERRLAATGMASAVHIKPGYVPDAEVDALFASHHVILAPYRSASQSGIVPLARAAGRPVVATDVGDLSAGIGDETDGLIVRPDDPSAFALAIERVLDGIGRGSSHAPTAAARWADVARLVVELSR